MGSVLEPPQILSNHLLNSAFYYGRGAELGLTDPVFQKRLKEAGINPSKDPKAAGQKWIDSIWHGRPHSWEKTKWVMDKWKIISGGRPFMIKGIQSVADAKKAMDIGCDGIVVSNHAGRQVDGAVASLDALEEIAGGKLSKFFVFRCNLSWEIALIQLKRYSYRE